MKTGSVHSKERLDAVVALNRGLEQRLAVALECLQQESLALGAMDLDRLKQVVGVKARAFDALAHDHFEAQQALRRIYPRLGASEDGPRSWILESLALARTESVDSKQRAEIASFRESMSELIHRVKALQQENALTVNRSLGWVDACIEEMAGGTGAGTYDAQGRRAGARGRGLGRVIR